MLDEARVAQTFADARGMLIEYQQSLAREGVFTSTVAALMTGSPFAFNPMESSDWESWISVAADLREVVAKLLQLDRVKEARRPLAATLSLYEGMPAPTHFPDFNEGERPAYADALIKQAYIHLKAGGFGSRRKAQAACEKAARLHPAYALTEDQVLVRALWRDSGTTPGFEQF